MHFNNSKCQIISISRRKKCVNFDYKLNNMSLERVDSVRDLGVEISLGFVWNDHVNKIVGKCNKMMGSIKRTISYEAPIRFSKTLYSTLIRSNLEYCSSVWNGTSKRNISLIEGVQRRATKFILHYPEED